MLLHRFLAALAGAALCLCGPALAASPPQLRAVLTARGTALDPATTALIGAMTAAPDSDRIALIDSTISALKAQHLWSTFDCLYVLAAADEQAARLNWIDPGTDTLSAVNSPTFTTDGGFTFDGATSYLVGSINVSALANYQQDDAAFGVWALTTGTLSYGNYLMGTPTKNSDWLQLYDSGGPTINARINGAGGSYASVPAGTGLIVANRTNSADSGASYDGGAFATTADASVAREDEPFSIGFGGNTRYSDAQIAVAFAGSSLSDADVANLKTILQTYLEGVGAVP